jgi:hypothetical protein
VPALPDGFLDEPDLEAAGLGLHQSGAALKGRYASGASADAPQDAAADAPHRLPEPVDADAEKSVDPERDVQARDASLPVLQPAQ